MTEPSLYERLGGVYSIAAVVDDFIDRIMDDPRLNANPKVDEAHHRVSKAGFKYLVTEQVCWAAGGPQKYTGRSMRDSHIHLDITAAEWLSFMDDLQQTLSKFGVPDREQKEIFAIVDSTVADLLKRNAQRITVIFRPQRKQERNCDPAPSVGSGISVCTISPA